MITPNPQAIAGQAPVAAFSPKSDTPCVGAWARLRHGSPWLDAFPRAWVPVHALMPHKCEGARGEMGWDLENKRCTDLQLRYLARVLEASGKGAAALLFEGLKAGNRVQIGAGHLAFVEDFTAKKRCAWSEFTEQLQKGSQ